MHPDFFAGAVNNRLIKALLLKDPSPDILSLSAVNGKVVGPDIMEGVEDISLCFPACPVDPSQHVFALFEKTLLPQAFAKLDNTIIDETACNQLFLWD